MIFKRFASEDSSIVMPEGFCGISLPLLGLLKKYMGVVASHE